MVEEDEKLNKGRIAKKTNKQTNKQTKTKQNKKQKKGERGRLNCFLNFKGAQNKGGRL